MISAQPDAARIKKAVIHAIANTAFWVIFGSFFLASCILTCRAPTPCGTRPQGSTRSYKKMAKRAAKQREHLAPRFKSSSRKRSLTPPPPPNRSRNTLARFLKIERTRETAGNEIFIAPGWYQSQSALFRLPAEVRELIYREVVGQDTLHIYHLYRRLASARCNASEEETTTGPEITEQCPEETAFVRSQATCFIFHKAQMHPRRFANYHDCKIHEDLVQPAGRLAMMRTCRRIYHETVSLLYTQPTFALGRMDTLLDMERTMLPHRFDSIRSLRLHWFVGMMELFLRPKAFHDGGTLDAWIVQNWVEVWDLVGSMEGLQKLDVELTTVTLSTDPLSAMEVLLAACGHVRQCDKMDFNVEIVFDWNDEGLPYLTSPTISMFTEEEMERKAKWRFRDAPFRLQVQQNGVRLNLSP